jgi:hypothetical protein
MSAAAAAHAVVPISAAAPSFKPRLIFEFMGVFEVFIWWFTWGLILNQRPAGQTDDNNNAQLSDSWNIS